MPKPLEGVRVLDLTRVLAGPFCTMMLSDLGAEIIKVEAPGTGDDSRAFGPFRNGQSLYFVNVNRGKKSIAIDLKSEEGKRVLVGLAKECDVVVENFRPGTMEKLGLGWDVLKAANPRLIYAAVSGFGHTGPDSGRPAYDILVQAMGGVMSITGWPDSPPTRVGLSMGDITAAVFCSTGITTALYQREKTGLGQKIDVSMLDCQLSILENALVRFQVDGRPPAPLGTRHPTITPFQAFRAADAWFVVAVGNDGLWKKFCEAMKRPDLLADARFATNGDRTRHYAELLPELERLFEPRDRAEWLEILNGAGVPSAPVNTVEDVMRDRQLAARNMFVTVDDAAAGRVTIPGNPIKMESVPESATRPAAPAIGEHTDEVLRSTLGLDEAAIAALRAQGAVV
ncbi:MAG: CoA transferase [Spirochaetes bacterium]|nr:CoA transferase [Spirochaetota bacterium]MBU1079688.1 CoA transferase [Spirochaetota bacterium]